jgi:hypothetical protein
MQETLNYGKKFCKKKDIQPICFVNISNLMILHKLMGKDLEKEDYIELKKIRKI